MFFVFIIISTNFLLGGEGNFESFDSFGDTQSDDHIDNEFHEKDSMSKRLRLNEESSKGSEEDRNQEGLNQNKSLQMYDPTGMRVDFNVLNDVEIEIINRKKIDKIQTTISEIFNRPDLAKVLNKIIDLKLLRTCLDGRIDLDKTDEIINQFDPNKIAKLSKQERAIFKKHMDIMQNFYENISDLIDFQNFDRFIKKQEKSDMIEKAKKKALKKVLAYTARALKIVMNNLEKKLANLF